MTVSARPVVLRKLDDWLYGSGEEPECFVRVRRYVDETACAVWWRDAMSAAPVAPVRSRVGVVGHGEILRRAFDEGIMCRMRELVYRG